MSLIVGLTFPGHWCQCKETGHQDTKGHLSQPARFPKNQWNLLQDDSQNHGRRRDQGEKRDLETKHKAVSLTTTTCICLYAHLSNW